MIANSIAIQAADASRPQDRRWTVLVSLCLALLGTAGVALHATFWKSSYVDDAFITYVYADNIAQGDGLHFFEGNRAEGYSNFLWLAVTAIIRLAGSSPLSFSRAISLIIHFVFLTVTIHLILQRFRLGIMIVGILIISTVSDYGWCFWMASGMETTAFASVLIMVGIILSGPSSKALFYSAWLLALACLLRPDGLIFLPLLGLPFLMGKVTGRRFLAAAGFFSVLTVPLYLWRLMHFGVLLPNTMKAKGAFWSPSSIIHGVEYVRDYFIADGVLRWVFVCISFAYVVGLLFKKKGKIGHGDELPLGVGVTVFITIMFTVASGGDGQHSFRFLQPVTLGIGLLTGMAAADLMRARHLGRAVSILTMAVVFLAGSKSLRIDRYIFQYHELRTKPEDWIARSRPFMEQRLGLWHESALREIALRTKRNDAIIFGDVGFVTYVSQCKIIDICGLNDTDIASYYISQGIKRGEYYEKIVEKILRIKPVLCFYYYDQDLNRYVNELDRRLTNDQRLRDKYRMMDNIDVSGYSPRFVLHEYVADGAPLHTTQEFLARLEEMSDRCPEAYEFYMWAIEAAKEESLQSAIRHWTHRAREVLPFWASNVLASTPESEPQ